LPHGQPQSGYSVIILRVQNQVLHRLGQFLAFSAAPEHPLQKAMPKPYRRAGRIITDLRQDSAAIRSSRSRHVRHCLPSEQSHVITHNNTTFPMTRTIRP
jgi:hypothetical protein